MKKILSTVLFIFLLSGAISQVNAFNKDTIFLLVEKKMDVISKQGIKKQIKIYKKIKNKLIILKNKKGKNEKIIRYLYIIIDTKINILSIIVNTKNEKDSEMNIDLLRNPFIQTVHSASNSKITFTNNYIKYKTITVSNNITKENAIKRMKIYNSEKIFSEKETKEYIENSIISANMIIGYGQECIFKKEDKQKVIDVFIKWNKGLVSSNDFDFGECEAKKYPADKIYIK